MNKPVGFTRGFVSLAKQGKTSITKEEAETLFGDILENAPRTVEAINKSLRQLSLKSPSNRFAIITSSSKAYSSSMKIQKREIELHGRQAADMYQRAQREFDSYFEKDTPEEKTPAPSMVLP